MRGSPLLLVFSLIFVIACGSSNNAANSKEAIQKAVIAHLSSRKGLDLDMSAMTVEVSELSFRANEADATVAFKTKGSDTAAMTMKYTLERSGEGWKVKPKAPAMGGGGAGAGANPHGAMPGEPCGGAGSAPVLPPNHPPLPGGPKQ